MLPVPDPRLRTEFLNSWADGKGFNSSREFLRREQEKDMRLKFSLHGGRKCGQNCWHNKLNDFGSDDSHMAGCSDRTIVAMDENFHIVGVWKYNRYGSGKIHSAGTWVAKKFRKHGVAKKLWAYGIKHEKPRVIDVTAVTDRGYTLITSLEKKYSKIKWKISDCGGRKLRKLRK